MEPFIRFLGAHHTHPNSSVDMQCHFILKPVEACALFRLLVGRACEDVNLLKKIVFCSHIAHILSQHVFTSELNFICD